VTARPPAARRSPSQRGFGEVELDLGEGQDDAEAPPPPSTSRVFGPGTTGKPPQATRIARSKKPTERTVARSISLDDLQDAVRPEDRKARESIHDESTRIVSGDALSAITRPPPAMSNEEAEPGPPSARSGGRSASGVASHDRVAAMRDLYARGDAAGALSLAASLGDSVASGGMGDHPDASIVVEFGEQSIDVLDPFGGLIPLEDELAATATVRPGSPVASAPPPPAAHLTLTERQSIPRVLKSMAEVSKLKIDHRAGFLLAHVDGMQTLEEILDICAMPSAEALSLISTLKDMGVIEFE
jgi:hypothetical protein